MTQGISSVQTIRSAAPLLAAMTVLMVGSGLLGTVLGIRASLEGFPTTVIGVVMSCYYVGFLVGCVVAPRALARFGRVPLFAVLALLSAVNAVAYPLWPSPGAWSLIRALTGLATAGLFVVAESWLASTGDATVRGRLLAVYLLVVNAGYGVGQGLLGLGSPAEAGLFLVAAALLAVSILPLIKVRSSAATRVSHGHLPVRELFARAPLGLATSFVTGIGVGAILGIGAAYATQVGMSVGRVGLFVGAAMAGGIVLQWPMGYASDRLNRRHVIIAASIAGGAIALSGVTADPLSAWPLWAMFGFTAFSFPLYSLAISHVNDALTPEKVVPAAAVLLGAYGSGTLLGPIATSLAMDRLGPEAFWLIAGAGHVLLGVYGLYRLLKRRRMMQAHHLPPLPIGISPQTALLIEDTAEMPTMPR
ncbi:MAG TPA: MFS transporter [Acidimicrobiia bacterium]|nr:MFS transporter [Acidimicrobiia bacterium]